MTLNDHVVVNCNMTCMFMYYISFFMTNFSVSVFLTCFKSVIGN